MDFGLTGFYRTSRNRCFEAGHALPPLLYVTSRLSHCRCGFIKINSYIEIAYRQCESLFVPSFPSSMTPFQAGLAFCGVAAVVVAIVIVAILHGPQTTKCDGLLVRATVLKLVKQNSPLPSSTTDYELDSIRKIGGDTAAGNVSCEAEVFGEFNNMPYSSAHLTYTVTRQADGHVLVSVAGISGLHFP
ncbi:MAG TPA: hypothetical protein VN668_03140 [Stellaceae bacterium]|nr:hypothetical protein [Stellaceae bacterium]